MARNQLIQVRRDSASKWTDAQTAAGATPVLLQGEFGYDVTNKVLKIGDGSTLWGALPGVTAGTLSTALSPTLGGTGSIYGAAPAFSFYSVNSGATGYYVWSGAGGAGSLTTTDTVSIFGKGAALLANTAYEIDMLICYQLSPGANCTAQLSFGASNGLTFQTNGIDFGAFTYYLATADTTPQSNSKIELWNTTSSLSNVGLTGATSLTTAGGTWYLKTWVKGIIRTNAAGTFTPTINVSAGTATNAQMRDGSYIKLTPIGTGTAAPTTIGTWS